MEKSKSELDVAYQEMLAARKEYQEAKEEQLEAYHLMKDHLISHDEFEVYISDTQNAKSYYLDKKAAYEEIRASYNEKKAESQKSKNQ